ncbi:MAG: MotA/TolQ/ExbB proton channel family protein, partial [Candidatus Paceibacterota bacterium]
MTLMTLFIVVWVTLTIYIPYKFRERGIQEMQTIATTFGILGTFIGIIVGLVNFDTSDIQNAVPLLLDGLKFSFITSIFGMMTSLFIGLFPHKFGHGIENAEGSVEDKDKSEPELLAELLSEMKTLNGNISGESDTTLITQIQKMRTNIVDKQDDLNKAFDKFAESMVNSNIDALAEAIEKVMGDFNTTVNDKLSKAFDDFRKSVENLNVWQSEYKDQILSQTENLKSMKTSMDTTVDSINSVKNSFEDIVSVKEKFDELLKNLNAQLQGGLDFASS